MLLSKLLSTSPVTEFETGYRPPLEAQCHESCWVWDGVGAENMYTSESQRVADGMSCWLQRPQNQLHPCREPGCEGPKSHQSSKNSTGETWKNRKCIKVKVVSDWVSSPKRCWRSSAALIVKIVTSLSSLRASFAQLLRSILSFCRSYFSIPK